jgi:hypothetical protein
MFLPWSIILDSTAAGTAPVRPGAWKAPVLWTSLLLIAALLLGALVIALVDRWRKRRGTETCTPGEQLSHFRSLYERGELSREEFERVRTLLGGRLRQDLQMPAAPVASAGGAEPPPATPASTGSPEVSPEVPPSPASENGVPPPPKEGGEAP